jgi:hypothetical protein
MFIFSTIVTDFSAIATIGAEFIMTFQVHRRLGAAVLVLAWLVPATHAEAAAACGTSTASLHGWYAMLLTGGVVADDTSKYQVGAVLFDGVGSISGTNIYSSASSSAVSRNSLTGTYSQNSDCTLTLDLTVGGTAETFTVAVKSTGEAVGIEVDSSAVGNISFKPQFPTYVPVQYFNSSSLNGTFAAACIGTISPSSDLNLATFNNGALSGTDPFNNSGGYISSNVPYSGTYTVNSDGTFSGSLIVEDTPFDYYGVIGTTNTELEYIYANVSNGAPTAAFASCSGGVAPTAATAINLSPYYNVHAIFNNGTQVTNGGLDGFSYTYSENLLGSSVTWNGVVFALGPANAPDAVSNATVTVPAGQYSTLNILAGSTNIPRTASGTIVVTYTNGTQTKFNQTFSDWGYPKNYSGESIATATAYRVTPSGATQAGPWYLYGYSYPLNNALTLKSVTLPSSAQIWTLSAVLQP